MSLNRGKRRRRIRRRLAEDAVEGQESTQAETTPAKPPRATRKTKPLSQRSPLVPAFFAVLCVFGAVFTIVVASAHTVTHHRLGHVIHETVYGSPTGFNLFLGVFYLVLAGIEGFIAFRIYRARGGWR